MIDRRVQISHLYSQMKFSNSQFKYKVTFESYVSIINFNSIQNKTSIETFHSAIDQNRNDRIHHNME